MPREGGRFIVLGTSRDVPNMNKVLPLALYTHTPDSTALYAHHPDPTHAAQPSVSLTTGMAARAERNGNSTPGGGEAGGAQGEGDRGEGPVPRQDADGVRHRHHPHRHGRQREPPPAGGAQAGGCARTVRPSSLFSVEKWLGEGPVVGVCALQQLLCDQLLKQGLESLFLTTVSREYTF